MRQVCGINWYSLHVGMWDHELFCAFGGKEPHLAYQNSYGKYYDGIYLHGRPGHIVVINGKVADFGS